MADNDMDVKNDEPCERTLARTQAKERRKALREKAKGFDSMLMRMEKAIAKVNESEVLISDMLHEVETYLEAIRNEASETVLESKRYEMGHLVDDAHAFLTSRGWID